MGTSRRHFLKASIAGGGALGLGLGPHAFSAARVPDEGESRHTGTPPQTRPLTILILGGTTFIGPHQVRYALERGHTVSIFTRGRSEPPLFKDAFEHVEHLIGDREDNLTALEGRSWDVVIDNSGFQTAWTRDSAELLKDRCGLYLYVSSTGIYYPYLTTEIGEDTEVDLVDASDGENVSASYGVMKATSERAAREAFGDRTIVVRAGYIVGPGDGADRYTYWPVRLERGGEVLVPGKKQDLVQCIDVRDLTEWMIHLVENETFGTFNATGPGWPLTMQEFVHGVRAATSSEVTWTWIEDYDFLEEHRLTFAIPWIMPVDDYVGSQRIDVSKAVAHGLTYRPIALTAMETLEWWHSDAVTDERRANARFFLSQEREAEILATWKARSG
jgi:2'-hydroxyisoflavone reductase